MENYIPEFREREWEWKIAFPTFGNGNEKIIPKLWEREWEAGILGNGREREFPLNPASHSSSFVTFWLPPQSARVSRDITDFATKQRMLGC